MTNIQEACLHNPRSAAHYFLNIDEEELEKSLPHHQILTRHQQVSSLSDPSLILEQEA